MANSPISNMKIGIDIMGGDYAPAVTVAGAVLAQKDLESSVELVLIGNKELIIKELEKEGVSPSSFVIIHADDVIGMGEHPTKAFIKKPNSSIAKGFELLAKKEINAFASAGNTGAMLVGSMYTVKSIPGIIRPCITSAVPKQDGGFTILLDVGSNPDCKPDVLYQYAILGSNYAQHVYGVKNPKVGLLNLGEEEEKGSILTQATFQLMKDTEDFNFIGNVEGRDILLKDVDVVVCDGFTGNIVLKMAESFYTLMAKRNLLDDYFSTFNYENYGGTPILGVNSNVIIGHGISNDTAIKNMILHSVEVAKAELSEKLKLAIK